MRQLKERLPTAASEAVRWVPAENIHLTLKFLGDVSLSNLELLKEMLLAEVREHTPFEFSVGGLGAFPNSTRPRVLWVGVQAPPELSTLQNNIEARMERIGYAREERPFSPHLTLGRVSRAATAREIHPLGETLKATKVGFLGAVYAESVCLFKSDLRPQGAVYTRLLAAPLAGRSPA